MLNPRPQRNRPGARSPRTSVLPRPTLVGQALKAAPRVEADAHAKHGPVPEREPTLRGLAKGLPSALMPLQESTPPPKKSESPLVGLSRMVERSARSKMSTRLQPPGAPPAGNSSSTNLQQQRRDAEPTDHNVILEAYEAPPVPLRLDSATIDVSNSDELWEVDPFRRKRSTLLAAIALFTVAALGLSVSAYASQIPTDSPASRSETVAPAAPQRFAQALTAAPPKLTAANVEPPAPAVTGVAEPPPEIQAQEPGVPGAFSTASTPALTAEMLEPKSSTPHAHRQRSAHARHKRTHAERRAHKRKVARPNLGSSLDPFERFP